MVHVHGQHSISFLGYSHGVKGDVNPSRQRSRAIGGRSARKHVATRSYCTKEERQNMTQPVETQKFCAKGLVPTRKLMRSVLLARTTHAQDSQQSEHTKFPNLFHVRRTVHETRESENTDSDLLFEVACVRQFFVQRARPYHVRFP